MALPTYTWQDVEDLADALCAAYPHKDPLRIGPAELRTLVRALPGFVDDPKAVTQGQLEAIQAAWYDSRENTSPLST